ncbi:hypothetical protein ACFPTO_01785, partial [Paraburkholderia denitrificans]
MVPNVLKLDRAECREGQPDSFQMRVRSSAGHIANDPHSDGDCPFLGRLGEAANVKGYWTSALNHMAVSVPRRVW